MASAQWISTDHLKRRAGKIQRQQEQAKTAENVARIARLFTCSVLLAICSLGLVSQSLAQSYRSSIIAPAPTRPDFETDQVAANQELFTASAGGFGIDESEDESQSGKLELSDVIASVYRAFPVIEQARLERSRTEGQLLESYGSFDTVAQAFTLSEPTGFYRNYQHGIGVARQSWWGGYLSAGYRLGRGQFQPWYKERETNEGGEFKIGLGVPLLQGRAIDPNRLAVFQANLATQTVDPQVQLAILVSSRDAATTYWEWVSAGQVLSAQQELLKLAESRGKQFKIGVDAGKFAEIDLVFNEQLIAERKGKVLETQQKFRASTFKLSLFLRDESGEPMVPDDTWLPELFPAIETPGEFSFPNELAAAISRRPEPQVLELEIRQLALEQQLASNNLLPRVDVLAQASQDIGTPASSINDKGQFEMVIGLQGEVPIQRRKARGKIQSTQAKIAQLSQKLRMQSDKIGTEIRIARNSLELSASIVEQAEVALRASLETLTRYQFAFEKGKADLIYINLLETKLNESEIKLVEAQRNWFVALAELQAILGLDPLDQAFAVSQLPNSNRPGPGRLPTAESNADDEERE